MNYTNIFQDVSRALQEDIGSGDISARLIPSSTILTIELLLREDAVICGSDWFDQSFKQLADDIEITWHFSDGDRVKANSIICHLRGNARVLLTAERTALNFLQTLSATATTTAKFAELLEGTNCRLLDTRKTIPNLRYGQKYAVKCGGGINHRIGLFDAYLIKENHLAACGGILAAVKQARELKPGSFIEIEVESLDQLRQALDVKVDRILLDNFKLEQLRQAVEINQHQTELEASGDITLSNIREIALTGVDFVSIGSLTKHIRAIDFSLRYCE